MSVRVFAALALISVVILGAPMAALAQSTTAAQDVKALSAHVDAALSQLHAGNVAQSASEYDAFEQGWPTIERAVRTQDRDLYRQIEAGMTDSKAAFTAQPADPARIDTALDALQASTNTFVTRYSSAAGGAAAAEPTAVPNGMSGQLRYLDTAQQRIAANDAAGAAAQIKAFIAGWPEVEGTVATKAPETYTRTENEMAQAYGYLTSTPPALSQAAAVIGDMQTSLSAFAGPTVQYGVFDAAIILLREGFEALLVFAALLAFLKRSGNGAKQTWVWMGGGAGLALSVVIAVIVNVAFAKAGGSNRELLEGVTGLVAACMLVWMMFWLHSKSNVSTWNRYISHQTSRALATNSLLSLAAIAFLAVLREGAETVLFYVGIAPAINTSDLLLGLGAGAAGLAVVATLMLAVGVRIPIRPFFLLTSVLVFFLAFKFSGMGVHSLQVAGKLQAHTPGFLPSMDFFGVFPTWETTIVQMVLVIGTAAGLALTRHHEEAPAVASSQAETSGVPRTA